MPTRKQDAACGWIRHSVHAHSKKCHNLGQKSNRHSHFYIDGAFRPSDHRCFCTVFILTPSARRAHQIFQVDVHTRPSFCPKWALRPKFKRQIPGRLPGPKRAKKTSILRFLGPGEFPEPTFLSTAKFPRMVDVHTATCFCPKWNGEIRSRYDLLDFCPQLWGYPL